MLRLESGLLWLGVGRPNCEKGCVVTRRMLIMLVLTGLLFGSVFGMKWFSDRMLTDYLDAMPVPPATISTATAETMSWQRRLQASGSLNPVQGAEITTEVSGVVTAVHFEAGAWVEKGDPLLTLDPRVERGELARLEAQLELAELNRKRVSELYERATVSRREHDAAQAELRSAQAAVDAQAGRLAQRELVAPFSGRLGIRRANVGEYLEQGTPVVTLQSLDPIDADFTLPERHLGALRPGYPVGIRVAAFPDREFRGEVLAVEPRVNASTRNFLVRARLANPDHELVPGQFVQARVELPGENTVVVVPRTAIHYTSYGASVFVVGRQSEPPPKPDQTLPGMPPYTDLEVSQRFEAGGGTATAGIEDLDVAEEGAHEVLDLLLVAVEGALGGPPGGQIGVAAVARGLGVGEDQFHVFAGQVGPA